jgi:hypothetical protein
MNDLAHIDLLHVVCVTSDYVSLLHHSLEYSFMQRLAKNKNFCSTQVTSLAGVGRLLRMCLLMWYSNVETAFSFYYLFLYFLLLLDSYLLDLTCLFSSCSAIVEI